MPRAIVIWVVALLSVTLLIGAPAMAAEPTEGPLGPSQSGLCPVEQWPVRAWDRLRAWFCLGDGQAWDDMPGLRLGLLWRHGVDGESLEPRRSDAAWRDDRPIAEPPRKAPGPAVDCPFVDDDGDGLCDLCGRPHDGACPCDGDCEPALQRDQLRSGEQDQIQQRDQDGQQVQAESGQPGAPQGGTEGNQGKGGR